MAALTTNTASDTGAVVSDVEVEMSLLSRHQIHTSQHAPDRLLDRSGYAERILGRRLLPDGMANVAPVASVAPA